ncbi:glucan endo-1,3-beta-glucosidase A1-like [Paramacrobiotus metropolitanus]|uniref:glucan endo-1,3-beta-glucosidase A1-like n=1 Tax=Paramacrobiotus metropolitanus TaxID=2943436 RepID=UPI002445A6FA|nr:glucan endo-1,3-beta-glucosidase A1-like [Paramacrobiotus metropolitanus]XP_055337378.1 glucan endo-1,3-beta-glucosidase A1-like [Paramacrobiotus metropolitanus]
MFPVFSDGIIARFGLFFLVLLFINSVASSGKISSAKTLPDVYPDKSTVDAFNPYKRILKHDNTRLREQNQNYIIHKQNDRDGIAALPNCPRFAREMDVVFRDDFTGDALDKSKWQAKSRILTSSGLQLHHLPDNNVIVSKGSLRLIGKVQETQDGPVQYTSGSVYSAGGFTFKYGEVEWRAKTPKGNGISYQLWLTNFANCTRPGSGSTGCEDVYSPAIAVAQGQGELPNGFYTSLYPKGAQELHKWHWSDASFSLDYHIYSLLWDETALVWMMDGEAIFWTTNQNVIPDTAMQIAMDVSFGNTFTGAPNSSFPAEMAVDYVIVKQRKRDIHATAWRPTSAVSTLPSVPKSTSLGTAHVTTSTTSGNTASRNLSPAAVVTIALPTFSVCVFVILVSTSKFS